MSATHCNRSTTGLQCSTLSLVQIPRKICLEFVCADRCALIADLSAQTLSLVHIPDRSAISAHLSASERQTDLHLFHMAHLMVHADFGDSLPRGRGAQHHPL